MERETEEKEVCRFSRTCVSQLLAGLVHNPAKFSHLKPAQVLADHLS
jgi:hypothetical protein